jgi:hypothetical protein
MAKAFPHWYRYIQFDTKSNDWVYARRTQLFYPHFPERKEFIRVIRVVPKECGIVNHRGRCGAALNFGVFESDLPDYKEKRNPCLERMLAAAKEKLEPLPVSQSKKACIHDLV